VSVPVDPGVTPVEATITATALPDNAAGIAALSGDEQSGQVGATLAAPLVVVVTDALGNPIPGFTVDWTVTGGGSVSLASTTTDANGQASVTRTLGNAAGTQTAVATATGLAGSPVTFTHTATAGTATGVTKVSGDGQSGSPSTQLALPVVVQVLDGAGNPIPNRPLTWTIGEGGGSVPSANTTTDAQGNASTTWTLGPSVGRNTLNAVVSGLAPATFTATATAGTPNDANSTVSASPGTINVGGSSTVTVTVRDGGNNPVAGVSVTPASSGSGNTFTPASASTGGNGVATFTFSSTVAETKTITATAGGVALNDNATVTVRKVGSTVEITNDDPDPSTVGENVVVEFAVSGGGGTPTGDVTITVGGGSETCTGTLSNGSGSCTVLLTVPGTGSNNRRVITATYPGDAQFSGDTDTENHRVDPLPRVSTTTTITSDDPDPSNPGVAISVAFTVTAAAGTPTGNVHVTDANGGGCDAAVAAGSCQYTPTGTGPRTITATYEGDAAFNGSSDTEQHTVNVPPQSGFFDKTCQVNVSCTLEANASDDDGSIVNYTWDFGDGNPPESTPATTIDHTFTSISQPMVTLTVTDNNGATNSVTQPINVSETGGLRLK
jgi:hypothetical protein